MSDIVERLRERRREEIVYNDYEPIEELVDLLKDAADEIEKLREERDVDHYANVALYSALESERKKHEWISVNDRLPEEWEEVIACDEDAVVYPQARSRFDGRIWEWACEGMDFWVSMDVPVTHWMPLPDPPKGEEE